MIQININNPNVPYLQSVAKAKHIYSFIIIIKGTKYVQFNTTDQQAAKLSAWLHKQPVNA